MILLVLEGLGGLLVTLLNVVTSRALGHDFLPWESSLIPAGFGVLCLAGGLRAHEVGFVGNDPGGHVPVGGARRSGSWPSLDGSRALRRGSWWPLGVLGLLLLSRTGRTGPETYGQTCFSQDED